MSGDSPNLNVRTEQPSAGLNVVQDDLAAEHAAMYQKQQNLKKLEEEIKMLRLVLNEKVKLARDLRVDLGQATAIDNIEQVTKNLEDNINQLAEDVTQTDAYKKTAETLTEVGKVTADSFSMVTATLTDKFSKVKSSDSFNKISQNVSNLGSSLLDTVSNINKPKMQEFNEGNT